MALIDCPECGKQISEKAASCPACGYPIAGNKRHSAGHDFPFLTPIGELAAMVEGFAAGLREALHRGGRQPAEEKEKKEPPEDKP